MLACHRLVCHCWFAQQCSPSPPTFHATRFASDPKNTHPLCGAQLRGAVSNPPLLSLFPILIPVARASRPCLLLFFTRPYIPRADELLYTASRSAPIDSTISSMIRSSEYSCLHSG